MKGRGAGEVLRGGSSHRVGLREGEASRTRKAFCARDGGALPRTHHIQLVYGWSSEDKKAGHVQRSGDQRVTSLRLYRGAVSDCTERLQCGLDSWQTAETGLQVDALHVACALWFI